MNKSHELESTFNKIFNIWGERVIRIEIKLGKDINISDFNPLKSKLYNFIEQNIQTDNDTSLIQEDIFDIYADFMLSNVLKCSGDEIYCRILSDLILVNIFNRTIPDSLESIIEMRKESIIEQYLNDYNPMGNFGDLY